MPPKKKSRGRPRKTLEKVEESVDLPINELDSNTEEYPIKETKPNRRGRKRKIEEPSFEIEEKETSNTGYVSGKIPKKEFLNTYENLVDKKEPLDAGFSLWKEENEEIVQVSNFDQKIYAIIDKYIWTRGEDNIFFKDFSRYPSRKFFSEYFQRIPIANCISLSDIQKRSYVLKDEEQEGSEIHDYHKLLLDIDLLYKNCNYYNEPHSLIVKTAYQLVFLLKVDLLSMKNDFRNYALNEDLIQKLNDGIMNKLEDITEKAVLSQLKKAGITIPQLQREADDELHIIDPFLDLVSESDFPDYYQVIYYPISFNMIKNNLNSGIYKSVFEFYRDLEILFMNCKTFNPPESELFNDASNLLSLIRHLFDKFMTEIDALNNDKKLDVISSYEVDVSESNSDIGEIGSNTSLTTNDQVQELNPAQIELIKFGGKPKLYEEYYDNYMFNNEVLLKNEKNLTGLKNDVAFNKNDDLLSNILSFSKDKESFLRSSFSELKLTFFQDSRFPDKNVTNMIVGSFAEAYKDSTNMKTSLLKGKDYIQMNQVVIKNDTFSKDHYYSLKNPLYSNKNYYTQVQLNLLDLDIPFKEEDQVAPYNYKCQVSFNHVTGGSPIIITPKKQQPGEQSKDKNSLRCLYNIKLSEKRSLVSINIQREKKGVVDLSETVNLWFNV
ncbi:Chromatin structure-remodeling complex subunit HuRSC4 [Hanseniaspora uvarum DSM 2768]|nr:Chromatin structure-remodeling complex subunit HuRSC4 [Hanseniaspora uvarum DSM 2768]